MATITKKQTENKLDEIATNNYVLTLHNDSYNSFNHVIECLINICKHDYTQAGQCAYIVHFNGKCDIKHGNLNTITIMANKLKYVGLIVTIDSN